MATATVYAWGSGPSSIAAVRAAMDSEEAYQAALACAPRFMARIGDAEGVWFVEFSIDETEVEAFDAAARTDAAVVGWIERGYGDGYWNPADDDDADAE